MPESDITVGGGLGGNGGSGVSVVVGKRDEKLEDMGLESWSSEEKCLKI